MLCQYSVVDSSHRDKAGHTKTRDRNLLTSVGSDDKIWSGQPKSGVTRADSANTVELDHVTTGPGELVGSFFSQ